MAVLKNCSEIPFSIFQVPVREGKSVMLKEALAKAMKLRELEPENCEVYMSDANNHRYVWLYD